MGKGYQLSSSPGLPRVKFQREGGAGSVLDRRAWIPGPASPPPTRGTEATCLGISRLALSLAKGRVGWGEERAPESRGDSLLPAEMP